MVGKTINIKGEILSLYRTDYLAEYHTREMAKHLKKSHVTLLPHLKTLEENKVLISKISGKNKNYSLNIDNINTKNYLLSTEVEMTTRFLDDIFLLKKITAEIFKLRLQGTVILFGSYAKRTFTKQSDIDLFYIGRINDCQIEDIKNVGKVYGKIINVKKSTNFASSLRKKDPLIIEIIKNHIFLQNGEQFINKLWRYYDEKR